MKHRWYIFSKHGAQVGGVYASQADAERAIPPDIRDEYKFIEDKSDPDHPTRHFQSWHGCVGIVK